jgi:hypothetical protein
MLGNRSRFAFLALAAFALIAYSGCILSPDEEAPTPEPKPTYKPLTEKENLIENLLMCYQEHNITQYEALLHPDFIWYNQVGSVPEYNERTDDVKLTRGLFQAAEGTHPDPALKVDKLTLWLDTTAPQWYSVTEIAGVPCEDCWETTRAYQITAVMNGGDKTLLGDDNIKFIAIGVMQNGTKIYQFLRADDIAVN